MALFEHNWAKLKLVAIKGTNANPFLVRSAMLVTMSAWSDLGVLPARLRNIPQPSSLQPCLTCLNGVATWPCTKGFGFVHLEKTETGERKEWHDWLKFYSTTHSLITIKNSLNYIWSLEKYTQLQRSATKQKHSLQTTSPGGTAGDIQEPQNITENWKIIAILVDAVSSKINIMLRY